MVGPLRPGLAGRPWWHDAVVYQVYPRSFADSDGDGVGDLRGVTSRVPYLAALGVDAVWLSPFYPSALADGGYDVDDYCDVAPEMGTLADFDEMLHTLHGAGIRVMVDVVPNHTSDRHAWFRSALAAGPGSPERERYYFRPGAGPDGSRPPNDWRSMFGGSAWQRVEDRAPDGTPLTGPGTGVPWQWYLHLFTPQQPDLSWEHPQVREDFLAVLRFWADRGVDGFRVDVAPGLVKDLAEPYRPAAEVPWWPLPDDGSHPLFDRDGVHEIYQGWRRLLESYDPPRFAVAEAGVVASRRPAYAHSLGQAFNFQLQDADFTPASFRWAVEAGLADLEASGTTTWVLGCHDTPRLATRLGFDLADDVAPEQEDPTYLGGVSQRMSRVWIRNDGASPANNTAQGLRRARAAALLEMALPGAMYVYQGDELGLPEVPDVPEDRLQDPLARRTGGAEKGRDGCRVPLPWTRLGPSYGFGPDGGGEPHLPQPVGWGEVSVEAQEAEPSSTLALYRRGLALRRQYWGATGPGPGSPAPGRADAASSTEADTATGLTGSTGATGSLVSSTGDTAALVWLEAPEHVLAFQRGGVQCWTAFGAPVLLPAGEVLLSSEPLDEVQAVAAGESAEPAAGEEPAGSGRAGRQVTGSVTAVPTGRVLPADATAWLLPDSTRPGWR